jgi:hypothetical protein
VLVARHVWTVLCYKACIDQESKQVSLLDVTENVQLGVDHADFERHIKAGTEGVQIAVGSPLTLFSWWVRSELDQPEEARARLSAATPDGKLIPSHTEVRIDLSTARGSRVKISVGAIPWGGEGRYWWIVEGQEEGKDWSEVARIPLMVSLVPAPNPHALTETGPTSEPSPSATRK